MTLGLVKQVPHPGGADAHIQLHKIGAGDGEKRHASFAGHSLGNQRFACAWRAHQQHAFGNAGAQLQKLFGSLQKLHHLLQIALFLIRSGHILKRDLFISAVYHFSPRFTEAHGGFTAAAILLIHHIIPE